MAKTYKDSPFLEADYPHLNRPDAKFNPENPLFKSGGKGSITDPEVLAFKELVDAQAEAAFEAFMSEGDGERLTPGERKKWEAYKPYTVVEDEDGNPTDEVIFEFKQNSIIRTAEGKKDIKIALYDASGKKEVTKIIRGGSILRFRYAFRAITMKSQKKVGVRLDFSMVQVRKFAQGGGAGGFGAVDGDQIDDDEDQSPGDNSPAGGDGDY